MKPLLPAGVFALALLSVLPAFAAAPAMPPATSATTQAVPRKIAAVTLGNPRSLAMDSAGNLYVGDVESGIISRITPGGEVTAVGGAGASSIADPLGLAVGRDGTVYVADTGGNMVFRIPPKGAAVNITKSEAAAASFKSPTGVAVDSAGNAFVTNNADNSILKITAEGVVAIFAGASGNSGAADGKGEAASFATPRGIAIDAKDNLYVADEGNSNIRKITAAGEVTTLAGKAGENGSKDGEGASARFAAPRSLAAAADGTVYVADTDNHLIRKISTKGVVSTLAGKAGEAGDADGKGEAARFSEPRGIAVDGAGNVYVADSGNSCLRQITPEGVVTTITVAVPAAPK